MNEKVKKDVIYVDVEDDITDVVNKIKSSKERIIAIVPPKGLGIFRSAVNIRLLSRTAQKVDKKIVFITNNPALKTMSAAAKIPVSKTLQSKPEIPEIDILEVDGDDVIDGESLPISEFSGPTVDEKEEEILEGIDIDDNKNFNKAEPEIKKDKTNKSKKGVKVPDFSKFRKKIFIIGGVTVIFLIFVIWAIFFAPAAEVIIAAKTSTSNIKGVAAISNIAGEKSLLSKTETISKNHEISFDATGTREEGEAASGTLTLSQSSDSDPVTVAQGSAFSAGKCNFTTTSTVTIPGAKIKGGSISAGNVSVGIKATAIGEQCNLGEQKYISSIEGVSANGGQLSGGSKKTLKVVSQEDINNAKAKINSENSDEIKKEIKAKFSNDYTVLSDSFVVKEGNVSTSTAVNQEAPNGRAVLKSSSSYSMTALENKSIEKVLASLAKEKINSENQKIYDYGLKNIEFSKFSGNNIELSSNIKVGPVIDADGLKDKIKGKKSGEVRSLIEANEGIENVEVKFSFFWVNTIPNNSEKVKIEFTVDRK